MLFDDLLEPFLSKRPVAVMARACFEHAFAAADIDALFHRVVINQYELQLTFSSLVELLGAVVTRRYSSVHAAYRADPAKLAASLSSVYDKLNHTEPAVPEALVAHTARRLGAVFDEWPGREQPFEGFRLKVVDGNYLAGTDHRLKVMRGHGAAALPGMAIVVQDYGTGLVTDLIAAEDAYVNERALADRLLERVSAGEVIVADRNFCMRGLFEGIAERRACFVIRHHEGSALEPAGELVHAGPSPTGEVFEPAVMVGGAAYRLILVRRTTPTTNGDTAIRLLTNLPRDRFPAVAVAESYRLRWTIEATFLEVTRSVQCELNTLGYPKAALLTFALALCANNAVRVVLRALELAQGPAHPGEGVSGYYVVNEVIAAHDGMAVALPESIWTILRAWTVKQFAGWLLTIARTADWSKYRKTTRGPKKPVSKTKGARGAPHRSTFRQLMENSKPASTNRPPSKKPKPATLPP